VSIKPGQLQASIDPFWETLTEEQLSSVRAVAMDMWDPFERSVREHVSHAEVVFDKFHIAKMLNEAVDQVRRAENKALRARGDDRLVRTKYKWLTNPDRMSEQQWRAFRDLRTSTLKTARAWGL
jgi:transposase